MTASRSAIDYAINSEAKCLNRRLYYTKNYEYMKERYHAYWAINGKAIRDRRKNKYATDPAYRRRILDSNNKGRNGSSS